MAHYLVGVAQTSGSDTQGRAAVPMIELWSSPYRLNAKRKARKVRASAPAGTRVKVLNKRRSKDGRLHYLVSAGLLKRGWVLETFIRQGD